MNANLDGLIDRATAMLLRMRAARLRAESRAALAEAGRYELVMAVTRCWARLPAEVRAELAPLLSRIASEALLAQWLNHAPVAADPDQVVRH